MAYKHILFSVEKQIAELCLNRPDALNSFTVAMHEEVRDAISIVAQNDTIRVLIITGSGRGFCAGQDLNDRATSPSGSKVDLGETVGNYYNPLIRSIMHLPKPVIAVVNGVAAGAGSSLALACDIVIASNTASFIQSFANIGLIPDSAGSWNLPRALSLPRAKALAMLGNKLSAQQAADWGMIWQCVEPDTLMQVARTVASQLAEKPPLAQAAIKEMFHNSTVTALDTQLDIERDAMQRLGATQDYAEGVQAFIEKRKPHFTGQ